MVDLVDWVGVRGRLRVSYVRTVHIGIKTSVCQSSSRISGELPAFLFHRFRGVSDERACLEAQRTDVMVTGLRTHVHAAWVLPSRATLLLEGKQGTVSTLFLSGS